ncbi:MAG: glycosyltransferase family 2 protein [bacterium]
MKNGLTVIIGVYNEEEGISNTIKELKALLDKYEWKLLIINDGSEDGTEAEIKKWSEHPKISYYNHPYNKGYGAALKTGIIKADTDLVAFYDGDGQHRPEDLENLYDNLGNLDMIIGKRGKDSHSEWIRKPGKWILGKTANFLTGRKIPDLNSGLRVIKRSIIKNMLHLFPDGFSFSTTSTVAFMNMGYNVDYYPIKVRKRVGKSTVKQLKHGSSTLLLILRLIVLFNPLKVFIPAGLFFIMIGTIYEIVFGIILIQGMDLFPGAILAILTGVLIFFFGLVVDQVSELRKHLNKNSN